MRQDHQVKVHRRDFKCNLEDLDLRKIQEDLGSLEWDFDSAHEGLDLDGSDRLDSLAFCHVGCHGRLMIIVHSWRRQSLTDSLRTPVPEVLPIVLEVLS